jgi:hypothetical protein
MNPVSKSSTENLRRNSELKSKDTPNKQDNPTGVRKEEKSKFVKQRTSLSSFYNIFKKRTFTPEQGKKPPTAIGPVSKV